MFTALSERLRRLVSPARATIEISSPSLLAPLVAVLGEEGLEDALSRPLADHERIVSPAKPLIETRIRSHELAEQARKDGRIDEALDLWLLCIAIDSCGDARARLGPDGDLKWYWEERRYDPPPGIILAIARCANYLGIDLAGVQARFLRLAEPISAAAARLGVERPVYEMWAANGSHILAMIQTGTTLRPRRKKPPL